MTYTESSRKLEDILFKDLKNMFAVRWVKVYNLIIQPELKLFIGWIVGT